MAQKFTNYSAAVKSFEPVKFGLPSAIQGIDSADGNTVRAVAANVTVAQLNAGYVLVPADAAKTVTVFGFLLVCTGAITAVTDVRISDTSAGPVDIVTLAVANLTSGARFGDLTATGATFGAGYGVPLTAGAGVQIRKTTGGQTAAGGPIFVRLFYDVAA